MKKKFAIALSLLLVLSLTACGSPASDSESQTASGPGASSSESQSATPDAPEESGSLTIWWNVVSADAEYFDKFKGIYPGANIVLYPSEDLKTQTRLAVESGTAPDVFMTNAGSIFQDFLRADALMDLTGIIEDNNFMDRINHDYIKPYTSQDGKYYGFPASALSAHMSLYVNRDILAQAGITDDPKTVSELVDMSGRLAEAGFASVAIGNKDGWPAILLVGDYFAQQVTDYSLINQLNAGEITFMDCTEFKNAMNAVITLGQNNVFMSGWATGDYMPAIQTFAAGQTAFLSNGSWWGSMVDDVNNLGFEVGVIWLPLMDGLTERKSVQMCSDMCFVASASSKNVDGIAKFLDFISSEEATTAVAKRSNAFSVYPGSNEKIERPALFKSPVILDQFNMPALAPLFDWVFPTPVTEMLKVKIVECINGDTTLDQALIGLQAELDKNINVMPPV